MAKLWRTLVRRDEITRYSTSNYADDLAFAYNGHRYLLSGGGGWTKTEDIESSFTGYINSMYKSNGIVFAIILARMLLFAEGRFCWWEVGDNGEDGRAAGRDGLDVLERPWPNAGTAELLARAEQDVSLAGNFFAAREPNRLRRLRPDWVTIVLSAPPAEATESDVVGYWYHPGRSYTSAEPGPGDQVYLPDEVCHWSPIPDPDAQYRGMSWLTPVVKEVMADKAATQHKLNFFDNGATLGAIISAKENLTPEQFRRWKENFQAAHTGVSNAYRPVFLASPVDVTVSGADMRQLDFKVTQGGGETRLCAAGGVPPIIVGLSEGLASATYSNYGMARRKFGDHWASPQWKGVSTALSNVVDPPAPDLRLGVNTGSIPFLREDAKDLADITHTQIGALESGIRAGYKPDALVDAVKANDITLLKGQHTGLTSVQLLPPGAKDVDGDGSVDVTAADEAATVEYQAALESLRSEPIDWDIARARDYYGQGAGERISAGREGGGRFRKLSDRITDALTRWLNGDGDDDPLDGFTREQVRKAAVDLGLTPRRGASADEIKLQLLNDARRRYREARQADTSRDESARFRLGPGRVAAVYQESDGSVSLYEESNGKRGKRVVTVPDLAALQTWAESEGHDTVAEWAESERDTADSDARARQVEADKARAVSELVRDVDELVANEASDKALRARIRSRAKAAGVPDGLRDELLANVSDRDALRQVMDRVERDAGLTPVGRAGDTASFDPALHEPMGGATLAPGTPVVVARQGHRWGDALVGRAVVTEADDAPSPVKQASTVRTGSAAENLPPVIVQIDATSGSDVSHWRAVDATGLQGSQQGLLAAATSRVRTSGLANPRLRGESRLAREQREQLERFGLGETPEQKAKREARADQEIAALDAAMEQSKLPTGAVFWRFGRPAGVTLPEGSAIGLEWTDPGFVGTSARRNVAESFAAGNRTLMRIVAPEGTPAIGIQGGGEAEVLLGRGLRFRVVGETRSADGARMLDVEVVPADALSPAPVKADHPDRRPSKGAGINPSKARERLLATRTDDEARAYLEELGMSQKEARLLARELGVDATGKRRPAVGGGRVDQLGLDEVKERIVSFFGDLREVDDAPSPAPVKAAKKAAPRPTRSQLATQIAAEPGLHPLTTRDIRESKGNTKALRSKADAYATMAEAVEVNPNLGNPALGLTPAGYREMARQLREAADRIDAQAPPLREKQVFPDRPNLTTAQRVQRRVDAGFSSQPTESDVDAALARLTRPELVELSDRLNISEEGRISRAGGRRESITAWSSDQLTRLIREEALGQSRRKTGSIDDGAVDVVDGSLDIKPPPTRPTPSGGLRKTTPPAVAKPAKLTDAQASAIHSITGSGGRGTGASKATEEKLLSAGLITFDGSRYKVTDAGREAIAAYKPPVDVQALGARIFKLPDEAAIKAVLDDLGVADLNRLAKEFGIVRPSGRTLTPDEWRAYMAEKFIRDRGRWSWR